MKKPSDMSGTAIMLFLFAALLSIPVMIALIPPYFEMRTFNKFTDGPDATYVDALFSELRIEASRPHASLSGLDDGHGIYHDAQRRDPEEVSVQ